MTEEPSALPPAEESIEAETGAAVKPEPESGEPAPEPTSEPGFVCDCEEPMRSACQALPFYKEFENRHYCVLHYPGKEKSADFKAAFDTKRISKDFDLRGVWFPDEVDLSGFDFSADADFSSATFSAPANFGHATFSADADFSSATFSAPANFGYARFSADAIFRSTTFSAYAIFGSTTFSAYADFSFATFSADASFSDATFSRIAAFSSATFGSLANFSSAKFNVLADFGSVTFNAAAEFDDAQFNALTSFKSATFRDAGFSWAKFQQRVDFSSATFEEIAYFSSATFSADANFNSVTVKTRAIFMYATFSADQDFSFTTFSSGASFIDATFKARADFNLRIINRNVDFRGTLFANAVRFFGRVILETSVPTGNPSLNFQGARFEKPHLVSFHTVALRPHWFVNVDSRKFVFTNVGWGWDANSLETEIDSLTQNKVPSPRRLLAISCHQLAENAEANRRYEEASHFRYWAMDSARQTKWKGWTLWRTDWLHMLYWAVSGYGERIWLAFLWVLAVWIVFASLYTQGGFTKPESNSENPTANPVLAAEPDTVGQPLSLKRAWIYSIGVMSLQKPEPKPLTGTAQTLVLLETILGPLQAALLALAIRRKFMR